MVSVLGGNVLQGKHDPSSSSTGQERRKGPIKTNESVLEGQWLITNASTRPQFKLLRHHPILMKVYTQLRNLGLGAAILITVIVLFQSFRYPHTTPQSLRVPSVLHPFTPESWRSHVPRITKVTSLFGEDNEMFNVAIRTQEEHDRVHGYETRLFREKIVEGYWSKPSMLLSVIVGELAKDEAERMEWIMWVGPDVIVLNPQIPLEIFLPPADFMQANFLGTHHEDGLDGGVFFLRVHSWSVRMLIEVLSAPQPEGPKALEKTLRSDAHRNHVFYQPRKWYGAYELNPSGFQDKRGDLFVHFHDLGGDRWRNMEDTMARTRDPKKTWSVPLKQTGYTKAIVEYWNRIREAHEVLNKAWPRMADPGIDPAFRRLQYATTYEVDDENALVEAIVGVRNAAGLD